MKKNNQTIPFVFRRVNPHLPTKEITAPYSNTSCKKKEHLIRLHVPTEIAFVRVIETC